MTDLIEELNKLALMLGALADQSLNNIELVLQQERNDEFILKVVFIMKTQTVDYESGIL